MFMFKNLKQFFYNYFSVLGKYKKPSLYVFFSFVFTICFMKFYWNINFFASIFDVKIENTDDLLFALFKGRLYTPFYFLIKISTGIIYILINVLCIFLVGIVGVDADILYIDIFNALDVCINNFYWIFENFKTYLNWCVNHNFYALKELEYLVTKDLGTLNNFFKNSILPFFFYFYALFILTTIFSFFYLSFLGFYGVFILNLVSILLFWLSAILSFNNYFVDGTSTIINIGKWFVFDCNYTVSFEFLIDSVSYSFFFLTLTISVFVYMFTFSYFRYEPNIERFMLLLNSFIISMICLVFSGNCFVLFLGWELIGLTSFFLINFWSTKISVLKSAFKAFSFNKLSDVSLFVFLLLFVYHCGDANISVSNEKWNLISTQYINILGINIYTINVISLFLLISICIKSAQFGFHLWLPDSMEAPVPASALIHSATLVSAGIFLLLRFTYLFQISIYGYYIIPLIGSFTALYGGVCSVYQSDSKRILAYSTISHCGFLMVCFITCIPEYTILYLYVHGFFKAAIFLCLGNVIRFFRNVQDIRRMGGVWKYLPFECFASFVCLINLSGLPFTLGFYIKHLLLLGINTDSTLMFFVLVNLLGGAISGVVYSFRFFYYIFFDFKKSKKVIYNDANREILHSYYYTNSSLSSNLIISMFIIVSYLIIIYLFFIFLNKNSLGNGFNTFSINISKYEEFSYLLPTFANNISYFNWFLLILIMLLILVNWRVIYFNNQSNIYFLLNFLFYFILFIKL